MNKIIRGAADRASADKVVAYAKTLPGVKYAGCYRVGGKYHCIISGDMSDEVCQKILGSRKNMAERAVKV